MSRNNIEFIYASKWKKIKMNEISSDYKRQRIHGLARVYWIDTFWFGFIHILLNLNIETQAIFWSLAELTIINIRPIK